MNDNHNVAHAFSTVFSNVLDQLVATLLQIEIVPVTTYASVMLVALTSVGVGEDDTEILVYEDLLLARKLVLQPVSDVYSLVVESIPNS